MDLISFFNIKATQILIPAITNTSSFLASPRNFRLPVSNKSFTVLAKKRNSNSKSDSLLKQNLVEEVLMDEEEDVLFEDFEDGTNRLFQWNKIHPLIFKAVLCNSFFFFVFVFVEEIMDDDVGDYFEDEYAEEDSEVCVSWCWNYLCVLVIL